MSLTSHLDNKEGSIRKFFFEQLPNTRSVIRECRSTIARAETIRPAMAVPWRTLGTAIDYRLRYYFGVTPHEELIAWRGAGRMSDGPLGKWEDSDQFFWSGSEPGWYQEGEGNDPVLLRYWHGKTQQYMGHDPLNAVRSIAIEYSLPAEVIIKFFADLDEVVGQLKPSGRRLERSQEEELSRYCVVLALFEEVFRAGPRPTSPLFIGADKRTTAELLAIAETHWIDDLCSMSSLFYGRFSELFEEPVILNPTFDGSSDVGGADGDFILNDCLIDIKATINPVVTNINLYQLLGYVLLDYHNQYQIDNVGIYFARQGVLLQWPLQDLLNHLTNGVAPPLQELRERFQQVAQIASQETKTSR